MGRYPLLELPHGQLGKFAKPRRVEAIKEAISWHKGPSREAQIATCIFSYTDADGSRWEVVLAKPGKEAFLEKRTNPNDMFPRITRDGIDINYGESFAGIWNELETISKRPDGIYSLELIARFVIACAYMVCHESKVPGVWRISTSPAMLKFYEDLERRAPTTTHIQGHVPMRVFLNMIEAISLQEDVKYFTLGGNRHPGQKGRENNLKTTAGVLRYLCQKESISWLIGGLSRQPPGVLAMTQAEIREYYPPIQ